MSDAVSTPHSTAALHPVHPWRRYVALGDSFTEGIGDPDPHHPGAHRGWADRVAEELAYRVREGEDFSYANLAIRGRLIAQIAAEQAGPALDLQPDLITLCAGGNDVIRPGGDPDGSRSPWTGWWAGWQPAAPPWCSSRARTSGTPR